METMADVYRVGLDIGSTTAKIAVIDGSRELVFSRYRRHNTRIIETIEGFLQEASCQLGECRSSFQMTGSAGMGISERSGIPFIQEVVAVESYVKQRYPGTKTLVDVGGEDSKMIFFHEQAPSDIRMNGNCAGGTGSFIDQMITLLGIGAGDLDRLAGEHHSLHPIASRCGVFAKTDVQNLLARKVPKADIAASIFHAIAIQCCNALARGSDLLPGIVLCGGPFVFFPKFREIFLRGIGFKKEDAILPDHPAILPALGAAEQIGSGGEKTSFEAFGRQLKIDPSEVIRISDRLPPLFKNNTEFAEWKERHKHPRIDQVPLQEHGGTFGFLGIDSGSTTTKIVVSGEAGELLFVWYGNNQGNPIDTVVMGMKVFREKLKTAGVNLTIAGSAVTGYGEDLIKAALGIDNGVVETIAHFKAAKTINPDVSFVLDIGGQDMKAIFIDNGTVSRIEINEACSSGCGSFIETFGNSLGYAVEDFAEIACLAEAPCDLGTRCTVFMNSKVKQSLREGAGIGEISAGLSYSVIKNCLFKVLKLSRMSEMGNHIVVQGGTFKNLSVVRALEVMSGREIRFSNIPELMGAYGAALHARERYKEIPAAASRFIGLENLDTVNHYQSRQIHCKGCENVCVITRFTFANQNRFFSGNKCQRFFAADDNGRQRGFDFFRFKTDLLLSHLPDRHYPQRIRIGLPRCLGMYETLPFWVTLFERCRLNIVLSPVSTMQLCEKGSGTVVSDSICFPAKLMHGHVADLMEKGVDRIFYPLMIYEAREYAGAVNTFNCPVVSSYGEVIDSAMDPRGHAGIPLDKPTINFDRKELLKKACEQYLGQFGVPKKVIRQALEEALSIQNRYKKTLRAKGREIIEKAKNRDRLLVVLAGRPYHLDPLINHKTPEALTSLGVDIITEDALPLERDWDMSEVQVLTQWSYPNRIYHAASWVAQQPDNVQLVQFNSFGCGPDAMVIDEAREILKSAGKNHTLVKIDEINSTGSVVLRLRSMIESLKLVNHTRQQEKQKRISTPPFEVKDRHRTILAPHFADAYSPLIPSLFALEGYQVINLPKPDRESVEQGLRYSSHDICYPATIVIGDIIKALKSNRYNLDETAVGIVQTGGQCRASSYLSLIKKAMITAGYENVPVVSCTLAEGLNDQPGFEINWLKLFKILLCGALFTDALQQMVNSTRVREKEEGISQALRETYLERVKSCIEDNDGDSVLSLLKQAVADFNNVRVHNGNFPKIGMVGEIYIKYNGFGHQHMTDWLVSQGVEVVVPPIIDFFLQDFINGRVNRQAHLRERKLSDLAVKLFRVYANRYLKRAEKIMQNYRYHSPVHQLSRLSQEAGGILNLANQFGEGWLIAAEIAAFAEEGINHVVSVQPFGCIANHVISKGVEQKIRKRYPDMNLLFLDFEAGTSEVNILNRLHFMVKSLKD